jgi:hypothetical protein
MDCSSGCGPVEMLSSIDATYATSSTGRSPTSSLHSGHMPHDHPPVPLHGPDCDSNQRLLSTRVYSSPFNTGRHLSSQPTASATTVSSPLATAAVECCAACTRIVTPSISTRAHTRICSRSRARTYARNTQHKHEVTRFHYGGQALPLTKHGAHRRSNRVRSHRY